MHKKLYDYCSIDCLLYLQSCDALCNIALLKQGEGNVIIFLEGFKAFYFTIHSCMQ